MSLFWKGQSILLSALIDSGADESFIDAALALQLDLPTVGLNQPLRASALDSRLLANVTHRTVPIRILLSGNHQEELSLHIIDSPHIPVILGHPWLVEHNPHIDWKAGKIIEWGLTCHATCLLSTQPHSVPSVDPGCDAPDLSTILTEYHDL